MQKQNQACPALQAFGAYKRNKYRNLAIEFYARNSSSVLAITRKRWPEQPWSSQAELTQIISAEIGFDLDDIEKLEVHNEDFRAQENEEQLLAVYFDIPSAGSGTFMTTAEISDKLVIKGSIKKPMPLNRLGMILRKAGFQSKMVGITRTRGWIVRERDAEEINANRSIEGKS